MLKVPLMGFKRTDLTRNEVSYLLATYKQIRKTISRDSSTIRNKIVDGIVVG